ncbi:unnamed protein product [Pleuronectes platessa]|uniref:Uncharacterized protein n=1 Tax=Pleuronectes platessa TaxID=8262 RepID=A0A9N7V3T2_PLEPL|nr:unnamed protein product [Pleuronectes platessa]
MIPLPPHPRLSQLRLFVVQQAEAAALSLGFSLSKVLVRFAAQTYFCCLPPPHLCSPITTSTSTTSPHPSNHHPSSSSSSSSSSRTSSPSPRSAHSAADPPVGQRWPMDVEQDPTVNGSQHSTDRGEVMGRVAPMAANANRWAPVLWIPPNVQFHAGQLTSNKPQARVC